MSTATVQQKLTKREEYWVDILTRVSHGEPVEVQAGTKSALQYSISTARKHVTEQGRTIPEVMVASVQTETGWRLSVRNWRHRQPTAEQRQLIEAFAVSSKSELFVRGLAVQDIESLLQEIATATGVQLRAEYAVWHVAEGQSDRACWICKGGA